MSHLERKRSHECPPTILEMECKVLMLDANEKALRKAGKKPPRPGKYEALVIM